MLPKGRYNAAVTAIEFGRAGTGNEQIAISLEIVDGERVGEMITYFGTFTDAAAEYTIEAIRGTGYDGEDLGELPELAAAGKLGPCSIVVTEEHDQSGNLRTRVRFINRPGGGRFKFRDEAAIAGNDLRSFASRMKSAMRAGPKPGERRQARPNGGGVGNGGGRGFGGDDRRVPPPDDGDLPFASCALGAEPSAVAGVLRRAP